MAKKKTEEGYPERPLKDALADPKAITEVEDRPEKDQIEDYHQTHPTLGKGKAKASAEG